MDALCCVALLNSRTQARIALLEGERRSFENVKLDLMRRIKMLEYALRMERSVFLLLAAQFVFLDVSCLQLQTARPTPTGLFVGPSCKTCCDTRPHILHVSKGRRPKPQGRKQRQLSAERRYLSARPPSFSYLVISLQTPRCPTLASMAWHPSVPQEGQTRGPVQIGTMARPLPPRA